MDSGNSGSMQSSSGGDEEYDSRAESISALLSTNPPSHVSHLANHHAPPHPHQQSQSSLFDPLSNFFDPTAVSSRSPILNLDMVWPRTLRSDPNSTDLGSGLMPSSSPSSSAQTQSHPFFTSSQLGQGQNRGGIGIGGGVGVGLSGGGVGVGVGSSNSFQGIQIPQENNAPRGTNPVVVSGGSSAQNERNDTNNNVVRNPKKRSRASRRAPTTVLTTDTTNFRAMVQEFTGIPAPPFTSSPFPRTTRLDLFGSGAGAGGGSSMMRSGPLDSPPPYLLRPFPHKVHQAPQLQQTTSFVPPTTTSSTTSLLSSGNIASTSTAINYQQPPPGGGGGQNHLLMQNPALNFHSLLQAQQPKFPLSKPQLGPLDHQISHHGLEEFGLGHHGLGGLPNLMSSELPARNDGNNPTTTTTTTTTTGTTNWGEVGMGSNDNNNNNNRSGNDNNNNNVDHHHHHQQHQGLLMRSINGTTTTTNSNGKVLNYSASSSDFHGGKGPESVTSRSEGMVESWICSSD